MRPSNLRSSKGCGKTERRSTRVSKEMVRELTRTHAGDGILQHPDASKGNVQRSEQTHGEPRDAQLQSRRAKQDMGQQYHRVQLQERNNTRLAIIGLFSRKIIGCGFSHSNNKHPLKMTFRQAYDSRHPEEGLPFRPKRKLPFTDNATYAQVSLHRAILLEIPHDIQQFGIRGILQVAQDRGTLQERLPRRNRT